MSSQAFFSSPAHIFYAEILLFDSTQPPTPTQVHLQDFTFNPLLTEAFHDPNLLLQEPKFLVNGSPFRAAHKGYLENLEGEHIIVIRRVLDKVKISYLLLALVVISPGLGLAVGICSHKAEVGIAVSAGIFALASFVQGLAAWLQG